jgi:ketopantoate reductase
MTGEEILAMLQVDLGELYPSQQRQAYLNQAIASAKAFIAREGIDLTDSVEDGQLVEMYAAYLIRKRADDTGMPRMLRWALNNRLFSQKAGDGNA